jgi:hypothetical protein
MKNNTVSLCTSLHLGYLRISDNSKYYITNPYLWYNATLDITTNEVKDGYYTVTAFDHKDIPGYHRSRHDNYEDAKKAYDALFLLHEPKDKLVV